MGLNELKMNGKKLNAEDLEEVAGGVISQQTDLQLRKACRIHKERGLSWRVSFHEILDYYDSCDGDKPSKSELKEWFDANWDSL